MRAKRLTMPANTLGGAYLSVPDVVCKLSKIPFMLIIGENEANDLTVSVRKHGKGDLGTYTIEQFAKLVQTEINQSLKEF